MESKIAQKAPYMMDLKPGTYHWCKCGHSGKQPFWTEHILNYRRQLKVSPFLISISIRDSGIKDVITTGQVWSTKESRLWGLGCDCFAF
jgi:hypothetical protein